MYVVCSVIEGAIAQALPEHPKKEFIFSLSTAFGDAYLFQVRMSTKAHYTQQARIIVLAIRNTSIQCYVAALFPQAALSVLFLFPLRCGVFSDHLPPHSPVLQILSDSPFSLKSTFTLSIHLRFGLPLLLPFTSILITLFPTYSSSLLMTCQFRLNLLSCNFLDVFPTFDAPLITSFLILSIFVTPRIDLNIFISAMSNVSCTLFASHVSALYIIACLITGLYTFPLTLGLVFLSHRTFVQ